MFAEIAAQKTTNFSCNPQLSSGSSDPSRYFLNIDVESRLKNIDHIKRKCNPIWVKFVHFPNNSGMEMYKICFCTRIVCNFCP